MAPDYEYSVLSDIAIDPNKEYDVTLVDFNIYNIKVTSIDKKHNKDYEFHTVMNNTVGVNIETEDTETCIMVKFNTPFTLDLYSIFSNEKENADLIVKGFYLDSKYTREFKDIKVDDYVLLSTLYLYAKTEYRTRTINYYSDGELVNSAIYTSEKDYVDYLPEAKEGYNFLGWYDENLTMKYDIDEVHSDYNLYAKWQLKSFLITLYDGNNFLLDMIVKYNQKVDKLYTPPEKKGYTFLGWKIGYSDVFYTGKEMVNNDLTLFATWSKNKYTVTYKDDDKIINTVELSYKEPYGKYEISPKEGLDFCGWLIEGTSTYIKATDVITDNVVLIADWETHKCKVQYLNQYNQILYNGEVPYNCSIGSYLYTPEKPTGYHFIGWKLHGEDDLITNDLVVNTDIILDGVFEIDEYVVTFINDEEIVHSFKVKYNNRLNELFEVEKEGYDFIGWKYNDYYLFANVNDLVTSDISLIATYNIHQYNITFYDDNKQIVNEKKINYNDTFASNLFIPEERIGYTFLGWKEEGGITYISETDVVTKDYNLYEEC